MPTTVAIQGQWGSGKTSFMNLLRSILCEDRTSGNDREPVYYGIWINMWEYSIMQTPEQTLIGVIKGMIGECAKILEQKNPGSSVAAELKEKAWSFIKKTCAVVASSALKTGINAIGINGEEVVSTIKETFGDNHDFNETRPKEFRDAFSKAVNDCLAG